MVRDEKSFNANYSANWIRGGNVPTTKKVTTVSMLITVQIG